MEAVAIEAWDHLPVSTWQSVFQLLFTDVLDTTDHTTICKHYYTLRIVSKTFQSALEGCVLDIDLSTAAANPANVPLQLLTSVRLRKLNLGANINGETLLRMPEFIQMSAATLEAVGVAICCSDTLTKFSKLHSLAVHATSGLDNLYPSILNGLSRLERLEIVGYPPETLDLEACLVPVSSTIKEVVIHAKTGVLFDELTLNLPPASHLQTLENIVRFDKIQTIKAAAVVKLQMPRVLHQVRHVKLQAASFEFIFPDVEGDTLTLSQLMEVPFALTRAIMGAMRHHFASMLDGQWETLEFQSLEDMFLVRDSRWQNPASMAAFAESLNDAGQGRVTVKTEKKTVSIFDVYCVTCTRRDGAPIDDEGR